MTIHVFPLGDRTMYRVILPAVPNPVRALMAYWRAP